MINIAILGTGCSKCKLLEQNAREALSNVGKEGEITKVTEVDKIAEYGVMSTPGIVINEEVKSVGTVASVEEIEKWLV